MVTQSPVRGQTMTGAPCLLTYAFSTYPTPLQTGTPSQVQQNGVINLAVFTPNQATYCNQIQIAVPVGVTATDLTAVTPTVGVSTAKWAMSSYELVPGDDLGLLPDTSYAVFTFQCKSASDFLINYNLVLGLQAVVNQIPGDFTYLVREFTGTSPDPSTFTPKSNTYTLTKTTSEFFLQNLVATAVSAPTVPATEFANGAAFTLSWESNGTFYQLYKKGSPAPIYAGTASSYTVSGGLATDTTFILVASVSGNPASDTPSGGYESLYLYAALTVTISNPDLTPRSVNATGAIQSSGGLRGGSLTVDTTATIGGNTVIGTVGAPANLTVNGGAQVTGNALIVGNASVSGSASLGSATVANNLQVMGSTQLVAASAQSLTTNSLTVSGSAQVGTLNATNSSLGNANANGLFLNGGFLRVGNVGNFNAVQAFCTSPQYFSAWFVNYAKRTGDRVTGVASVVADGDDYGFATNGQYTNLSSTTIFTHLPTRNGHRVVTSPMSLEVEVQFSGQARLEHGKVTVWLEPEVQDMIHAESYRVLLTPTGQCNGLAVVHKAGDHFVVEELGHGKSHAGFDWFVIARKPAALGAKEAHAMPRRLPALVGPVG